MNKLFALKNGTTIRMHDGREYVIKRIYSIFEDLIIYAVDGDRRYLTSEEIGPIDDPEVTTELIELYFYYFGKDLNLHEEKAWGLLVPSGKVLVFCPEVRAVVDNAEMVGSQVGRNFAIALPEANADEARIKILNAIHERLGVSRNNVG